MTVPTVEASTLDVMAQRLAERTADVREFTIRRQLMGEFLLDIVGVDDLPDELGAFVDWLTTLAQVSSNDGIVAGVASLIEIATAARDEQVAVMARVMERMEEDGFHVVFGFLGSDELHPDWCRECRVDQARDIAVALEQEVAALTEENQRLLARLDAADAEAVRP